MIAATLVSATSELDNYDYIVWNHGLVLALPPSHVCAVLPSFLPRGGKTGWGGELLQWQPQKPGQYFQYGSQE